MAQKTENATKGEPQAAGLETAERALHERLVRLEKGLFWTKWGLGLAILAVVGLSSLLLWPKPKPGILEGTELRIRNEEGQMVGWLRPDKKGVTFSLIDLQGVPRVMLTTNDKGASIALAYPNRVGQVVIESSIFGPQINLFDPLGRSRSMLGVYEDETYLWIVSPEETRRTGISIDAQQSGLALYDTTGARIHLGFDETESILELK
ncbi:MAG: hypothetical protein RBU29_08250 [bacterium]|nr:hypothetical protein [bacterium]